MIGTKLADKKYNFAFILERYFPFGGQQRDMLRFAQALCKFGHSVTVFTNSWEGEQPPEISIELISAKSSFNHKTICKIEKFVLDLKAQNKFDCIVGFCRLAGLDLYFAADAVLKEKMIQQTKYWQRFLPRYKTYLKLEENVFCPKNNTQILALTDLQKQHIINNYNTPSDRITVLPPGVNAKKIKAAKFASDDMRNKFRGEINVGEDKILLLTVGSAFSTKGIDRAIRAVAALPSKINSKTIYAIVGKGKPAKFEALARKLNIEDKVKFLGPKDNVAQYFNAADLLIHPARNENTGLTLLEALVAGLPVIATENCGYAKYISQSQAGRVVDFPFEQGQLNSLVAELLAKPKILADMSRNAIEFCDKTEITTMTERFVEAALLRANIKK